MINRIVLGSALLLTVASIPAASLYATGSNDANKKSDEAHKVTLCHATHSATNPYVKITVSVNAAGDFKDNGNGDHAHHTGPVATSKAVAEDLKKNHTHWGDIIPAGKYNTSLNWTSAGKAMFENDCKFAAQVTPGSVDKSPSTQHPDAVPGGQSGETQEITELPQTGVSNPVVLTTVATVVAYIATSLGINLKTLFRRIA